MRYERFGKLLFAMALALLAGCNGDGGPGGTTPIVPGDVDTTGEEQEFLPVLFGAGDSAFRLAYDAMNQVANAVFVATRETNAANWVTVGTVTRTGTGLLDYQYAATPNDRLVLVALDGTRSDVTITDFRTDPTVALSDYVQGDYYVFVDLHAGFAFTIASGGSSLQVTSSSVRPAGGQGGFYERTPEWTRSITGTLQGNGIAATVDLTETGSRVFSLRPSQSTASDDQSTVTGTITWNGNTITVNEFSRDQYERDESSLDGTPIHTVRVKTRTCASSVALNGRTFRFRDASVRSSSRDGVVNELATWNVSGALVVDGVDAGALRFSTTPARGINPPTCVIDLGTTPSC